MTGRERVEATFAGDKPDTPAIHHVGFSSAAASLLLGREAYVGGGIQRWREARALWQGPDAHAEFLERSFRDAVDIAKLCGNDIVRPTYWRYPRKPTSVADENTLVFESGPESTWAVLRFDPPTEQCGITPIRPGREVTIEDLDAEVAQAEKRAAEYVPDEQTYDFELRAHAELGDAGVVRCGGVAVGVAHDQVWMEAIALRPDLVKRSLAAQATRAEKNMAFLSARGLMYWFGGFDFAAQTGPMFSPASFNELVLPALQRVSRGCRTYGGKHLFASDGNLWAVADTLFGESGVDGYYEIDRRASMDLRKLRQRFPDLTLVGNISSHTLHLGSPEEVAAEVNDCLDAAEELGRIVVGMSNYIVPGTPEANVMAVFETVNARRAGA